MTTFAPTPPKRAGVPAEPPCCATVEWPVWLNGPASITVTIDGASASAVLVTLAGRRELAAAPVVTSTAEGLRHIDAPGVVAMTLTVGADGEPLVVYARTPLLEAVGVPGGCVERPRLV